MVLTVSSEIKYDIDYSTSASTVSIDIDINRRRLLVKIEKFKCVYSSILPNPSTELIEFIIVFSYKYSFSDCLMRCHCASTETLTNKL